ncbi:hypothetical protein [Corynebacterium sp.]|uniref:hypothetical protein n=1 Tax=Corynebacterium sp. TaxID=1720 RepID=UPI0026DB1828|nr:hypothetical protein [Corynebacterium sp.]MDO4610978.1 hypothetical protein [Corynebacterium sp.]
MPRIARRALPTTTIAAPTVLTAAATPETPAGTTARTVTSSRWQADAWAYYDEIGELRYVCSWLSNSLSRVALVASDIDPDTGQPTGTTDDPTVAAMVADIAGGPAGQAALLGRLGTFLTIPGEGWIAVITRTPTDGGPEVEEWHVLSAREITRRGTTIVLHLEDGTDHDFNPDRDLLTRVHRPHPQNARAADSPVRAALPILREISRTSAAIDGAAKSRLAGNGLLLLPQEISMPVADAPDADAPGLPTTGEPVTRQVGARDVMEQLQTVMTTAISDSTSAAAMVPIVLQAPADTLDKIRHLRLESDVTDTALKTREAAIHRLALSLDVPREVLTGIGDTNHWNAWQIDEAGIKTHIAPLMTIICDALTAAVLRPLLRATGHPAAETAVVWFDVSDLALRPNRGEDATAAFDRGVIGAETLRRELGFVEQDAPAETLTTAEKRQLALQLVRDAPTLVTVLGPLLGLDIEFTSASPAPVSRAAAPYPAAGPPPQPEGPAAGNGGRP